MTQTTAPTLLHVAFCITELEVGGAERCLVELATRLDPSRFVTSVACLGPRPRGDRAALAETLEAAGVPARYFNAHGIASAVRVLRQLRRHWQGSRPDVVQTFLFHANAIGAIAARRAGVPRIITGLRVAEPNRRWRRPIERIAGRVADRHVAVSEGVARFACEKIGLLAEKIVVIPNGVVVPKEPIEAADLSRLGVPVGRRAIAFVGRIDEQKGIEWLIEQLPEIIGRLPQHDLLVVGTGPLAERLRRRAARLGVGDRVHFCGWRNDVPAILAACDLLVFPSHWEGMPNVVLEAMAAARPVVGFDVEGIVDGLGDDASRQIAPRRDRAGFVERLVEIASNAELQGNFGRLNRNRADAELSVLKMVARYEEQYIELSAESARRAMKNRAS
jgi:glycosyltransferase involved in cell wall biosynthesis